MSNSSISKTIAKNTIYLYLRMIVTLAIKLYSSRVILQILGIEDFGLYNLISGVIVMMHFITSAMSGVSQRYLSFEIGRNNIIQLRKVFTMSLNTNLILTLFIVIIFETIGIWFINYQLVIPYDKVNIAMWVYQLSILTFIANIIRITYNSLIIAYENMQFFSIISIAETIFQLVIIYCIRHINISALVSYNILLLSVSIIFTGIYIYYCHKNYREASRYKYFWDGKLLFELLSYSGWSMVMSIANLGAQQGGNFLLNRFFNLSINAAYGIANQVGAAIYMFSSNFQTAFVPQITKKYANGDRNDLNSFIFNVTSISYYMMLIISIPVLLNMEYILDLWLDEVPTHTTLFCQLVIIFQLIDSFQAPLIHLIFATGKIKTYSLWLSSLIILNIPLSWYMLSIGKPSYYILLIRVGINLLTAIVRTIYLKSFIGFPLKIFVRNIFVRITLTTFVILILNSLLNDFLHQKTNSIIIISTLLIFLTISIIYIIGINKRERNFILSILSKSSIFKYIKK